jgi:hypothetical protein
VTVGGYLAGVDHLFARGHGLFPASGGGLKLNGGGGAAEPPPPPSGDSGLTKGVAAAADDYQRARVGAEALDADIQQTADDGTKVGQSGRANVGLVRDTAKSQAAAITPATNSPAGVRLLVSTMDQRLSDMQRHIEATNAENQLLAIRLRQMAASYQAPVMGAMGGRSPLSGFGGIPGGVGGLSGLAAIPASMVSQVSRVGSGGAAGAAPSALVGRSVGGVLSAGNAKGSESGLQKDTILARRAISAAFPEITDIGGVRADSLPWHPQGKAIDCMIPDPLSPKGKALGDQVLGFALSRWKEFNLNHVIWQDRIWTAPDHSEPFGAAWGDITQAHRDHVHVATNGGGYPHGGEVYRV